MVSGRMARRVKIAPSILAADFSRLGEELRAITEAGADYVHIDVMDGHFVPNMTIGPPVVASIRKITSLPLDAHLMIEKPERFLDEFIRAGVNWLSVHVEADAHLDRTLQYLKANGIKAGVAINPGTALSSLDQILPLADYVLIMTVNPGFGGQNFIPYTLKKVRQLRETIVSNGYPTRIEVDGGIGPGNLNDVLAAGAEIIVAGSAVFSSQKGASEAVKEMKGIAERHSRNPDLV